MTDGLINGLNSFSTRVIFNDTQDELYCDRQVDTNHDVVLRGDDLPAALRPAGFHCHHATERQAFHYGLHRMLKGQQANIDRVTAAWQRDRDPIRSFVLLGAHAAKDFAQHRRFNYDDAEFEAAFLHAQHSYFTPMPKGTP